MGIVYSGIPPKIALDLKSKYNLEYFIETGTYRGKTAEWASHNFAHIYTMEVAYKFYIIAGAKLRKYANVQLFLGYSQEILWDLLPKIPESALIWLDAHWSKDLKYERTKDTTCPVISELAAISVHDNNHVVLIDDLRLFGTEFGWPSTDKITRTLKSMGKTVHTEDDIFVAVPK